MQERQKALNLLGLAQKAGKLITGSDLVCAALKNKKIKVVILASDVHQDTLDKVTKAANNSNVDIINEFSSSDLTHAIGKKRKVMGITDSGFYSALVKKINDGGRLDG